MFGEHANVFIPAIRGPGARGLSPETSEAFASIFMPNIELLEPNDAPEPVKALYLDFQRRMGFPAPPNFIKIQGHSLAAASGSWGLVQNTLIGGTLPRTVKEMLFSAISADRACRYCEAAHVACCRMLGVDDETLEQLTTNIEGIDPPKIRAIIRFGLKCSRNPQILEPSDFAELKNFGLPQSEIVELISMAGLAVYANIMADATAVENDDMFTQL